MAAECTREQIQAMKNTGLSEAQIRAACQTSNDLSWLSGKWYVWKTITSGSAARQFGLPEAPTFNQWMVDVSGKTLTISVIDNFGYIKAQEMITPQISGNKMTFAFQGTDGG